MDMEEFCAWAKAIEEKEHILDGTCKHLAQLSVCREHIIKRAFPLHWIGARGKTRIVIEYDNDKKDGYIRITTEHQGMLHCDKSIGPPNWGLNRSQSSNSEHRQ